MSIILTALMIRFGVFGAGAEMTGTLSGFTYCDEVSVGFEVSDLVLTLIAITGTPR